MRNVISTLALALAVAACSSSSGPQSGSQTNWLRSCDSPDDCGGLDCLCGVCTEACAGDAACGELLGASCVAAGEPGAIALCSGQAPPSGLCLPGCDAGSCAPGSSCVAEVCVPTRTAGAEVAVDQSSMGQALVGFGASVAFSDGLIVESAQKAALFELVFADAGLDVLRLRNRYGDGGDENLLPSLEIVEAASEKLGRPPVVFMTSGTPPVALKANGSRVCAGDAATCTLVSSNGAFDYAGFAAYWRASLEAYAGLGVTPDYVSIQSHPGWMPPLETPLEACLFLPEEGTTSVTVDGASLDVAYPGYREALGEVQRALSDLPNKPKLSAPEAGIVGFSEFVAPLAAADVDALAFHAYGLDGAAIDVAPLQAIGGLAQQLGHPVLQTEMQAEGFDTAVLIHHALVTAGASAYLQNELVVTARDSAALALALLTESELEPQATYYAFLHYAKYTDPGWVRVAAASSSPELLSSAWSSPEGSALTVVLVNPSAEAIDARLLLAEGVRSRLVDSSVTRTVFNGVERAAALGELAADGVVSIPGGAVVTVALRAD